MPKITDNYQMLRYFCTVIELNSFAKAAQKLNVTSSAVSKVIKHLEHDMGTPLLIRTTRSMTLTDAGKIYYERGKQLLIDWQSLHHDISSLHCEPSGTLRVTVPVAVGQTIISPIINKFMRENPAISIELHYSHKTHQLVADNFDIAIRTWKSIPDSPLFKLDLIDMPTVLVTSPDYLSEHGSPNTLKALTAHRLLAFNQDTSAQITWRFEHGELTISPYLVSNDYLNLIDAAQDGLGIAKVYAPLCQRALNTGKLVTVLDQLEQQPTRLSALYRQKRQSSLKVDRFLSFLEETLISAKTR